MKLFSLPLTCAKTWSLLVAFLSQHRAKCSYMERPVRRGNRVRLQSSRLAQAGGVPGFTLLELLVVIAILATIAVMGLPALKSSLAKATETVAANNLRQLALGELQYAADHDGAISPAYGQAGSLTTWKSLIFPYVYPNVASTTTLATMEKAGPTVFDMPGATNRTNLSSVGVSWYVAGAAGGALKQQAARLVAISKPSRVILFTEMVEANKDGVFPPDLAGGNGTPGTVAFRRDSGKTAMMAFFDGHVEKVSEAAQVYTGQKGENLWIW